MASKSMFKMDMEFYAGVMLWPPQNSIYIGSMSLWSINTIDRSSHAERKTGVEHRKIVCKCLSRAPLQLAPATTCLRNPEGPRT